MGEGVHTKEDVLRLIRENRDQLLALGVKRLGLFGSFVRDDPSPTSDIDMLAEFEPGQKTFDHFMDLCFLLEEIFMRRVEVVTPESLSPHIGPHILKEIEYVSVPA